MNILFRQFFGKGHSWGVVGAGLARALIKLGHNVDIFSTNGIERFPNDLKTNLIGYAQEENNSIIGRLPNKSYDCQFSYTCIKNFPTYLSHGQHNRLGMWCWEWPTLLPSGFAKHHSGADCVLVPSKWAKDIFVDNKIPEKKIKVLEHGINPNTFNNQTQYPLFTKKSIKILVDIGQNHKRKNIENMFRAYFKSFNINDDVCLVAKILKRPIKNPFDIDPLFVLNSVKAEFKNAAEVELITEFVPDMIELYNSCDIVYSLSHCEGFYIPSLMALAMGKINVCPRYGGQLDHLNDDNSLLISGKTVRAPLSHQYWGGDVRNIHFESDMDDAIDKLKTAVKMKDSWLQNLQNIAPTIKKQYDWDNVIRKFITLCK